MYHLEATKGMICLMKMYLDCIHCFVRQALDAVRLFTDNESIHEQVLRTILSEAGTMDFHESPACPLTSDQRSCRGPRRKSKNRRTRSPESLPPKRERRGNTPGQWRGGYLLPVNSPFSTKKITKGSMVFQSVWYG